MTATATAPPRVTGPSYPAHTSVGVTAIAFQDAPAAVLPAELRDDNPLGPLRVVDGRVTREASAR